MDLDDEEETGALTAMEMLNDVDTQESNDPSTFPADGGAHHHGPCGGWSSMSSSLKWAAVFAALGGILFGYDIGIISGALLQLEEEWQLSVFQKELVVSLMLVGAIMGSLTGGYIIDYFGRRRSIMGNAGLFVIGAVGLCAAQDLATLLIARVIVGYAVSISAVAECVYISEIAPAANRGSLVSLNELGITIGIFLSYLVNYCLIETPGGWRIMFGLSVIPALAQGIGMAWMPASPRWLLLKGYVTKAEAALRKFRVTGTESVQMASTHGAGYDGADPIKKEIGNIRQSLAAQTNARTIDLIKNPTLRRCMLVGCGIVLFQQFTGQPNVLYYGATIFKEAGFSTNKQATLAQMVLGIVKVIATIISLSQVDKMGRRKLLLWGTVVMVVALIVLASVTAAFPPFINASDVGEELADAEGRRMRRNLLSAQHHRQSEHAVVTPKSVRWISMISLLIFVVAYAFSYGPVSWLVLSEIFPDDIRGRAVSIATIFNWGSNLIVSASFLSLLEAIGSAGAFFLYAACGVLAFVFVYATLPETKGATLEQIQQIFNEQSKIKVWKKVTSVLTFRT